MRSVFVTTGKVFLVCVLLMSPILALAQEVELDYGWGTVTQVTETTIVLNEYDYEQDAYSDVTYDISQGVKFDNINSAKEIQPGMEVEIGFIVKDEKKVAVTIYLEKESAGDLDTIAEEDSI
jgi:hypothetical protein